MHPLLTITCKATPVDKEPWANGLTILWIDAQNKQIRKVGFASGFKIYHIYIVEDAARALLKTTLMTLNFLTGDRYAIVLHGLEWNVSTFGGETLTFEVFRFKIVAQICLIILLLIHVVINTGML